MRKILTLLLALAIITSLPAEAQETYVHFSNDMGSKHAKRMLKIFESISEEKWENAQKKIEELDEKIEKLKAKYPEEADDLKEALRPLPDLARAMMDISPIAQSIQDGNKHNAGTAYEFLKRVEKDRYARYIDKFLEQIENSPLTLSDAIDKTEGILHNEVKKQNTVAAYERLLNQLRKNSKIRKRVNDECEQLTFEEVIKASNIGRCKEYLERFPMSVNSKHYKRVTEFRDSLAYDMMPQTEAGMREYLRDYPDSYIADKAKANLYEYAFKNLAHTEKAYKTYVMEFPDSPRLEEARDSMFSCAWQNAEGEGTYKAYDTFCRAYPKAKMIEEAKEKRIMAGRKEFARLSAKNVPEELRKDSIIVNFIRSKEYSIYSRRMYGVRSENVDTVIENITGAKGESLRKIYTFDEDGLIANERHSQKGYTYYEFGMEEGLGFYLAQITQPSGKAVTYTPKFSANGQLTELQASDGSRETYQYPNDSTTIRSTYAKAARTPSQTERYVCGRLMETNKGGVRTVYEYNDKGDAIRKVSNSGSKVLGLTTFEYTYDENGCWTECRQKAVDGSIQERRDRTYITTIKSSLEM